MEFIFTAVVGQFPYSSTAAFIQNGHQHLQHLGSRLLDLVKDEHRVGILHDRIKERFVVIADIACRRAQETGYTVWLTEGIRVRPGHTVLVRAKGGKGGGQCFCRLRFSCSGWAISKNTQRLLWILLVHMHCRKLRHNGNGMILSHDPPGQLLLQLRCPKQLRRFRLRQRQFLHCHHRLLSTCRRSRPQPLLRQRPEEANHLRKILKENRRATGKHLHGAVASPVLHRPVQFHTVAPDLPAQEHASLIGLAAIGQAAVVENVGAVARQTRQLLLQPLAVRIRRQGEITQLHADTSNAHGYPAVFPSRR